MDLLLAWIISFVITVVLLRIVFYQIICLSDLEHYYINHYVSTIRINNSVLPEFVAHGVLCFTHLFTGHWIMFLLCVPYACYNVSLYIRGRHLLDVTEVFNKLSWEKRIRLRKFVYLIILLILTLLCAIWSVVDEQMIGVSHASHSL